MIKIPSYEEAVKIVKSSNGAFYEKEEIIGNKKFSIFNYRLADVNDFQTPLHHELRGITYNNETGEAFPSIHKFFNQGENEKVAYLLDGDIEVREKLDGSMIQPVITGDNVLFKTKGTFYSNQAKLSESLAKETGMDKKIMELYNNEGIIPLFEFISPSNQIVVRYEKSELRIIQARRVKTGEYLAYEQIQELCKKYELPLVQIHHKSYEELLYLQENAEGIEGWIIWNKEQNPLSFRKIKTKWYFTLHHLIQPDNLYEHDIIDHILNETIDDVLSQLEAQNPKKQQILEIQHQISAFFNKAVEDMYMIFINDKELFDKNRKEFVFKYKNHYLFPVLMKTISFNNFNEKAVEENLKIFIKKHTNKLEKARQFLTKFGGM